MDTPALLLRGSEQDAQLGQLEFGVYLGIIPQRHPHSSLAHGVDPRFKVVFKPRFRSGDYFPLSYIQNNLTGLP